MPVETRGTTTHGVGTDDPLAGTRWIGREVPPSTYTIAEIGTDRVDQIPEHGSLGQWVTLESPAASLAVDLVAERDGSVRRVLVAVCREPGGQPLAAKHFDNFPLDHFGYWMAVDPPLAPGRYVIEVRNEAGAIGWSTRSTPATAFDGHFCPPLEPATGPDGSPRPVTRAVAVEPAAAADPVFRRRVELSAPVRSATMTAVGLGYGVFRINGVPISDAALDPDPTAYDTRVLYRTHDVTDLLSPGANVVTAELGRGFYGARGTSIWGWHLAPWHAEPALLAVLRIRLADGTEIVVRSDEQWRAAAGPTLRDELYGGETTDRGALPAGWTGPDFHDDEWDPAVVVAGPAGRLEAAAHPPIRRQAPLAATGHWTVPGGGEVYDFGQVTAGWVRLEATARSGDRIELFHGEKLDGGGDVECVHHLYAGPPQTDVVIAGPGDEGDTFTWEPSFTYKGFRYVRVRTTGDAAVTRIQAVPVHTDVQPAGSFATSEPTLQWIDQATARTILNNLHGVPTDTPLYEKNGWTADAHLIAETAIHHFEMHAFWRKWLADHRDAQLDDGTIPLIVPTPDWGLWFDPAWNASYPLITRAVLEAYGDEGLVAEHADGLGRWAARLHDDMQASGWIWAHHSWGDWLAPGYHFAPEGPAPTATTMAAAGTAALADLYRAIGRHGDADELDDRVTRIGRAYHERFFDASTGTYRSPLAGYRQSMNILPLAFGLVPDEHRDAVFAGLVADLEERTDRHLNCGAASIKHLLPVLCDGGRWDLALAVATQATPPGWGVWPAAGSSTLWESWDLDARSHDHYFLGSIGVWLHRYVAGLRPTSPGYATFDVVIPDTGTLSHATLTQQVPAGQVSTKWERSDARLKVEVTVPPACRARVVLPPKAADVRLDDQKLEGTEPIALEPGEHTVTASTTI